MQQFLYLVLFQETLSEKFGVFECEKSKIISKKVDPRFKLIPEDEFQFKKEIEKVVFKKQFPIPVDLCFSRSDFSNRYDLLLGLQSYNKFLPVYKNRLFSINTQLIIQEQDLDIAISSLNKKWVSAVGWLKNNKGEVFYK